MQTTLKARLFERERWTLAADVLAVGMAASLPWSTSATGIFAALWLIAVLPTLDAAELRRVLVRPVAGLPVALWLFAVAGMAWADVPLRERLDGLESFHRLLFIPLLFVHFARSDHAAWVLYGFLTGCIALLALSWLAVYFPALHLRRPTTLGVPVKDYLSQGAAFTVCVFVLAEVARERWMSGRRRSALAAGVLSLVFLANVLHVAASRTAVVVIPVLLALFGWKRLGFARTVVIFAVAAAFMAAAWSVSPRLRDRVLTFYNEVRTYQPHAPSTSAGERLEFWRKSLQFIAEAPVIGHGTGSILEQFRRAAVGETGLASMVAANPHNQTFAVAIQLGLAGAALLWAMWIAHWLLFGGEGLAGWIGLLVVTQNVVGSLFNSHLFDFTHGWGYVLAIGVTGGLALRDRAARSPPRPS